MISNDLQFSLLPMGKEAVSHVLSFASAGPRALLNDREAQGLLGAAVGAAEAQPMAVLTVSIARSATSEPQRCPPRGVRLRGIGRLFRGPLRACDKLRKAQVVDTLVDDIALAAVRDLTRQHNGAGQNLRLPAAAVESPHVISHLQTQPAYVAVRSNLLAYVSEAMPPVRLSAIASP